MTEDNKQTKINKQRILYVHYGENWLRGSEIVLLDLLKSAKNSQYTPILWCNSEILAKQAANLGIEVILDNFVCLGYWTTPKWNFLQFLKLLIKANVLLKQYYIALVHCNNGAPCQWLAPICKIKGIPLLLHLHARYLYRDRVTLLFHAADSIVGVSKSVINIFKENEFPPQQVSVIYNGINPRRVLSSNPTDIRAELSAKTSDFVLLYIGSLIPRKSVHQLLHALDRLKKDYQVKLAIVGSGAEKTKLMNLATKLHLNDEVQFFSATNEVANFYSSNADCFISVPCEEVFGLTLAEASIAKLPIITNNISGINEIYTDKKNALLVSPHNTDELIDAIKCLIEKPCLGKKLASNARHHILEKFSLEQQFIAFNFSYQTLLQQEKSHNKLKSTIQYVHLLTQVLLSKLYKRVSLLFLWRKTHE